VNAPPLDRVMLAQRESELLDEQESIELQLAEPFDPQKFVDDYRAVIALLETEQTELGKAEFRAVAQRMRTMWTEWQGEDCLYEMAFGEPIED